MFDGFGALLAGHFTVIAYDQRDSGGTRNPPVPYGLAEMADDAAALIAALGYERAHVFGTSLGGVIAQVLAARHPGRIDRLVLSSTFRAGVPPLSINPEVFPRLAALRAGLPGTAAEIATYFFPAAHIAAHPEVVDIFNGTSRTAEQRQRRAGILARAVTCNLAAITAPTTGSFRRRTHSRWRAKYPTSEPRPCRASAMSAPCRRPTRWRAKSSTS
jgi:3-oxoadipate enol-lactonase